MGKRLDNREGISDKRLNIIVDRVMWLDGDMLRDIEHLILVILYNTYTILSDLLPSFAAP